MNWKDSPKQDTSRTTPLDSRNCPVTGQEPRFIPSFNLFLIEMAWSRLEWKKVLMTVMNASMNFLQKSSQVAKETTMGKVTFNMTMSLDGFVAGPNDGPENGMGDGGHGTFNWDFIRD